MHVKKFQWSCVLGFAASFCGCGDDVAGSASDSASQSGGPITVGKPTESDTVPTSSDGVPTGDAESNSGSSGSMGSTTDGDDPTGEVETRDCLSQECTVPNSHKSIQEAVDDGDCKVVNICPGTYYENVVIHRSLTVKRAPVLGGEPVVIDGAHEDRVIAVVDDTPGENSSLDVIFKRLTLQNGDSSKAVGEEKGGGGLLVDAYPATVVVDTCVIQQNYGVAKGGGVLTFGPNSLQLINSRVQGNTLVESPEPDPGSATGGGVAAYSRTVEVVDTVISDNKIMGEHYNVGLSGGGLSMNGAFLTLKGADVSDNHMLIHHNQAFLSDNHLSQAAAKGGGISIAAYITDIDHSHVDRNAIEIQADNTKGHEQYIYAEGGGIHGVGGYLVADGLSPSFKVSGGSTFNGNKVIVTGVWTSRGNSGADWRVMTVGGGGISLSGFTDTMDVEFSDVEVRGNEVATMAHVTHGNQGGVILPLILWSGGGGVAMFTSGYQSGKKIAFLRADISGNSVSMIQQNAAADVYMLAHGGGLFGVAGDNEKSLELREVALAGNSIELLDPSASPWRSSGRGGGLYVAQGFLNSVSWARIFRSTLSGNTIQSNGGAHGGGAAIVSMADSCADLAQHPTATFENTTISRNSAEGGTTASEGGGLWLYARIPQPSDKCSPTMPDSLWQKVELSNVTVTGNKARAGGGIHVVGDDAPNSTKTNIRNSLVYGNEADLGPDCFTGAAQALTSFDYNAFKTLTQCKVSGQLAHNLVGKDPQVAPLADNGGFTQTQAIGPDGAAATLGRPGSCHDPEGQAIVVDQRGYQRPAGDRCDIGAFEVGAKP